MESQMENSGTNRKHGVPNALWTILDGHRWHATSFDGLRGILGTGAIEVRPEHLSLCRELNAISVFDFGSTAQDIKSGVHWTRWCGWQQADDARSRGTSQKQVGIWLRIRDSYADPRLIEAGTLHSKWQDKPSTRIIPGVEGGHCGTLDIANLDQVVAISWRRLADFKVWEGPPTPAMVCDVSRYIQALPVEPLTPFDRMGVEFRAQRAQLKKATRFSSG